MVLANAYQSKDALRRLPLTVSASADAPAGGGRPTCGQCQGCVRCGKCGVTPLRVDGRVLTWSWGRLLRRYCATCGWDCHQWR